MKRYVTCPLALAALSTFTVDGAAAKPVPEVKGILFCQVPNYSNGRCRLHMEQFRIVRRPDEARLCTLIPARPDGKLTDLTGEHFAAAIQPDLSYDGKKVIFSAKKTKSRIEKWNIYEMNLDGTGLRQLTKDMDDCIDPCYLPGGKIVYSSSKPGFRDEYDRDFAKLLFTANADGSAPEQITFNASSDTATIVLDDGRLLFTTWQHHGDHINVAGVFAFGVCNPDGTIFMPFYGNHNGQGNNTKSYPQQLTDGRVVFVDSAGHRHYNAGGLSSLEMENQFRTRKVLTPGQVYNGHNTAGRYASPYPLPDGGMICSFSPGRATGPLREDPAEDPHLGIYRFDFKTGRPGKLIFDAPHAQDYDALAIYEREPPPVIPSMVQRGKKTGVFLCTNAYLSDRPHSSKIANVGSLPRAKPGEIKAVRVVEGFGIKDMNPKTRRLFIIDILQMSFGSSKNGGNNFEQKRILGYAPVEPDGSFSVEVPADTIINLQTLDENNIAIETQLTWVWVRPGEKRLCIGCHENRETALPNNDCMAMYKKPHFAAPPEKERYTIDFRRDLMPIINRKCASQSCHGDQNPAGGLDLGGDFELVFHRKGCTGRKLDGAFFNRAYESFLQSPRARVGKLVIPSAARHSPLIWRLYGKKLGHGDSRVPYKGRLTRMPPPPGPPLTEAEKLMFVEWVDIGAQWDNIPGEDNLPGYHQDESKRLAKIAAAEVKKEIRDPKRAFDVRCTECHNYDYMNKAKLKKKTEAEWRHSIDRMAKKRPNWIHKSELPLITKYALANYCQSEKKK